MNYYLISESSFPLATCLQLYNQSRPFSMRDLTFRHLHSLLPTFDTSQNEKKLNFHLLSNKSNSRISRDSKSSQSSYIFNFFISFYSHIMFQLLSFHFMLRPKNNSSRVKWTGKIRWIENYRCFLHSTSACTYKTSGIDNWSWDAIKMCERRAISSEIDLREASIHPLEKERRRNKR